MTTVKARAGEEPFEVYTALRGKRHYIQVCVAEGTNRASLAEDFQTVLKVANAADKDAATFVLSGVGAATRMAFYYVRDILKFSVILFTSKEAPEFVGIRNEDRVVLDVATPGDVDEFLRCLVSARIEAGAGTASASFRSVTPTPMANRFHSADMRRMYRLE